VPRDRDPLPKKPWVRPQLRSEQVAETLARPACQFKPPGQGGPRPSGRPPRGGWGPAFS
jgi:hypothetical protein